MSEIDPSGRPGTPLWHRYVCPFSRCGGGTLTAWGIKRHVSRHMDAIHARLDATGASVGRDGSPEGQR